MVLEMFRSPLRMAGGSFIRHLVTAFGKFQLMAASLSSWRSLGQLRHYHPTANTSPIRLGSRRDCFWHLSTAASRSEASMRTWTYRRIFDGCPTEGLSRTFRDRMDCLIFGVSQSAAVSQNA